MNAFIADELRPLHLPFFLARVWMTKLALLWPPLPCPDFEELLLLFSKLSHLVHICIHST
jgi:hypothetical protein